MTRTLHAIGCFWIAALLSPPGDSQVSDYAWSWQSSGSQTSSGLVQGDLLHVVGGDDPLSSYDWFESTFAAAGTLVLQLEYTRFDGEPDYDWPSIFRGGVLDELSCCDTCGQEIRVAVSAGETIGFGIHTDGCCGPGVATWRDLVFVPEDWNQNGVPDAQEIAQGLLIDRDADGLPDAAELDLGLHVDSDADGLADRYEIQAGPALPPGLEGRSEIAAGADVLARSVRSGKTDATQVYRLEQGRWVAESLLVPSDPSTASEFGGALAVSNDGLRVAVGAPGANGGAGAVYVFLRSAQTWSQEAVLVPSDAEADARFGTSVAFDPQSSHELIVGAPGASASGTPGVGRAYLFDRDGGPWLEAAVLASSAGSAADEFGISVARRAQRAWVGAPLREGLGSGDGQVVVFAEVTLFGGAPEWQTSGPALSPPGGITSRRFGASLAANPLAPFSPYVVAIGAPDAWNGRGAVTIGSQSLELPDSASLDAGRAPSFGATVRSDGGVGFAIGAPGLDLAGQVDAGAAWTTVAVQAPNSDQFQLELVSPGRAPAPAPGAEQGSGVALGDGFAVFTPATDNPIGHRAFAVSSAGRFAPLDAEPASLSVANGGTQTLSVQPGPGFAGSVYVLIGSLSGTQPGVPLGPGVLALNVDPYTTASLVPGATPLFDNIGQLDSNGTALARFELPTSGPANTIGLAFDHAFCVLDPLAAEPVVAVSGPAGLTLIP